MCRRALGLWVGVMLVSTPTASCRDPGDVAFDRLERGLDEVVSLIAARDRGDLSAAELAEALERWLVGEGAEIAAQTREAARSLGAAGRDQLARRWRVLAERLTTRLSEESPPKSGLGR